MVSIETTVEVSRVNEMGEGECLERERRGMRIYPHEILIFKGEAEGEGSIKEAEVMTNDIGGIG